MGAIIPGMPLPILNVTSAPTTETLLRYYHQLQTKWTEHTSQSTPFDFGTAWASPQLSRVYMANRVVDVALADDTTPLSAIEQIEQHYASVGAQVWQWVMNPSAPPEQTRPMIESLLAGGYESSSHDIMYLERIPAALLAGDHPPIQIIPARASFKHARQLNEQAAARWNEPQLADAGMAHLDDPHYDALLALQDGQPAAYIGVLSMGEVGMIEDVFVAEPFRRKGIGTTMMSRAIEICARSLFKHIMLGVMQNNTPAINLYQKFGLRKIGEMVSYY